MYMSDKEVGDIYIIKNFVNNKKYVGKTTFGVQNRFSQHLREAFAENRAEYNYCLSRGIRKYGKGAFDVAVLAKDVPVDDLLLVEEHYIDMYNSADPEYGYNMSLGQNDTSNYQEIHDMRSDTEEKWDEITDDEIDRLLAEF